ncbi:hypothetical protein [Streptomyces spectabilis]|uniref:Uncharacterized protein n=1 Tax=Streptomyces spectabilis TaxID=68270 RepID=A0A7W8EZL4_STRST|nr:hypothetical protein [Streptomyces spectabilis]MBB5109319.1 hypothetical protein [Streptomyces spectabilis]GGV52398.1 hypothetical protein GCM10010245_82480 [Streptomyces spectabilis]
MPQSVDFFEALVTAYPCDADHAPLLEDPVHARVARAEDVVDGDLILAAVDWNGADYFNDQYTAHREPYDPTCQCGVCCHLADEPGLVVLLSNGHPWETCDPWPANALVLIVPARRLPVLAPPRAESL